MNPELKQHFENEIAANDVVLYMKGNPMMPMCGFSARVAGVFQQLGVNVHGVNVLENEEVRQGIKDFTDWPTIPQTYIKGEFIGGCDIILEMYETGELKQLLVENGVLAG